MLKFSLNNKVVYILGVDGSGKTAICEALSDKLDPCKVLWLRFCHLSSKVINAFGRLTGLSEIETYPDGTKVGYHNYSKPKFLGLLYICSVLFDLALASLFKVRNDRRNNIILDRFVYDTILDLEVDTRIDLFSKKIIKKYTRLLLPDNTNIFLLDVPSEIIIRRRPDVEHDRNFHYRFERYKELPSLGYPVKLVSNTGSISDTVNHILEAVHES